MCDDDSEPYSQGNVYNAMYSSGTTVSTVNGEGEQVHWTVTYMSMLTSCWSRGTHFHLNVHSFYQESSFRMSDVDLCDRVPCCIVH